MLLAVFFQNCLPTAIGSEPSLVVFVPWLFSKKRDPFTRWDFLYQVSFLPSKPATFQQIPQRSFRIVYAVCLFNSSAGLY